MFLVMMEQSRWRAKNPARPNDAEVFCFRYVLRSFGQEGTCASAGSPIDFVSVVGTVRVPQYFKNVKDVNLIDFGAGYKAVMGCRTVSREAFLML